MGNRYSTKETKVQIKSLQALSLLTIDISYDIEMDILHIKNRRQAVAKNNIEKNDPIFNNKVQKKSQKTDKIQKS